MIGTAIAAYLIYGTWYRPNAAQSVIAIPFANFASCERAMDQTLARLVADEGLRPITIKPYCTNVMPAWWVKAVNQP